MIYSNVNIMRWLTKLLRAQICEKTGSWFKMVRTFLMKINAIQPTQLYISSEKLNSVMKDLARTKSMVIERIPIKKLDNQIVFVDGHTRAFAAFL